MQPIENKRMNPQSMEVELKRPVKREHSREKIPSRPNDEVQIKRKHLLEGSEKDDLFSPCTLLMDLRNCESNDDEKGILNRLQEFFCKQPQSLNKNQSIEYVSHMIDIAAETAFPAVVVSCLKKIYHIILALDNESAYEVMTHLVSVERCRFMSLNCRLRKYQQFFDLYKVAVKQGSVSNEEFQEIFLGAEQSSSSGDHSVRFAAVSFLTTLLNSGLISSQELWRIEKLLSISIDDLDSRIRRIAFKGLLIMVKNGNMLGLSLYPKIKQFCEDTSKAVRIEALHLLKIFANRYPENEISSRNNAKLRLVDDAFASICHVINDSEPTVRAEAARLLGDFRLVSDSFLDQTLDKKLLNAMRMSKNRESASRRPQVFGIRRRRYQTSTEWSTGKKLGEDAPVEKTDEEQTSLIPTGACGAFVTALEDEFMIVRQAGVHSLGRLAADRPFLAAAALDHLADMFNDEIDKVRLDAIRSLTPLVAHGVLYKEQLETILTVLDEASPDSREALRVLLAKSTFATPECLRSTVQALLKCMKRYPIDRNSVFRCMSELGRHHSAFTQQLSDELFDLHPVFDITEPALDDQYYLAKLILILNAASQHRTICPLLPSFAVHHYRFLRLSMPSLVPPITEFSETNDLSIEESASDKNVSGTSHCIHELLKKTYKMMKEALQASTFCQREIEERCLFRDFEALCKGGKNVAGTARFLSDILLVISKCDLIIEIMSQGGDTRNATSAVDQGFEVIRRLKNGFAGIDCEMWSKLEEIFLHLTLLKLAVRFEIDAMFAIKAPDVLKNVAEQYNEHLKEIGSNTSTVALLESVKMQLGKKCLDGASIVSSLQANMIALPEKFPSLREVSTTWAQILEPAESPSEPMRFLAGLPLGILVNILLHNFSESDIRQLRIKVEYPDQSAKFYCPCLRDYIAVTSSSYRLLCKVPVYSKYIWSDSTHVRLGCVLKIRQCDLTLLDVSDAKPPVDYLPVVESPHSLKQAAVDMLIHPVQAKKHGIR